MVAEHDTCVASELGNKAKNLEGLRPAIDEIAHKPQLILDTLKANVAQKRLEFVETTLNIAYRVDSHGQGPREIIGMNLR